MDLDNFVLSESWLNTTVTNAEIEREGNKLSRLDRLVCCLQIPDSLLSRFTDNVMPQVSYALSLGKEMIVLGD